MNAPDPDDQEIILAVDTKLRQPGCVLLQAAYGCDSRIISGLFNAETWLVAPTPNICRIKGTRRQWKAFAADCNARFARPRQTKVS